MRALHAALRRDLSRLRDAAAQFGNSTAAPPTVRAGWEAFRAQLDNQGTGPEAINNLGVIVGIYFNSHGNLHGFELTPAR